jgi:hypothetical protein
MENSHSTPEAERAANKAVVQRYFREVLEMLLQMGWVRVVPS